MESLFFDYCCGFWLFMLNFSNTLSSPMDKASFFYEFLSCSRHPLVANVVISYDKAVWYMECPVSHLIGAKKTISFANKQVSPGSKNERVLKFEKSAVKGHANQHFSSRYRGLFESHLNANGRANPLCDRLFGSR